MDVIAGVFAGVPAFLKSAWPWLLPLLLAVVELGRRSFLSRIPARLPEKPFFSYRELRQLPQQRHGYSDRLAYVMAELANLAYYQFENNDDLSQSAILDELLQMQGKMNPEQALKFLERVQLEAARGGANRAILARILQESQFELVGEPLNQGPLQGFICRNTHPQQEPFIVVSFRGSEKTVDDWLTNADATPLGLEHGALVHSGFYKSFSVVRAELAQRVSELIAASGNPLTPVYYTGHSLGGAWALLACVMLNPDHPGACYTFGAPRIANYEFFFHLKNPVYRVVNSADIVPRVPPGILLVKSLYWLSTFLAFVTRPLPLIPGWFEHAASWVDKLKHYRHFGDQRYLTDIRDGNFDKTRLLQNPPMEDQLLWFWKGILAGTWLYPAKSHSMIIYIEKLAMLALHKNH